MCSPFSGRRLAVATPRAQRAAGRLACLVACGLAVSGCASSSDERHAAGGPVPQQVAQIGVPAKPHVVEMEADGLPVQVAPLRRREALPDDPTEPWSPNYGTVPLPGTGGTAPYGGVRPSGPAQQVDLRSIDAEDVIASAIIAHERRLP